VWNVPNLLSLLRVPLAVLFPFALGRPAAALLILVAAAVSDVLDGWWARTHGQVTLVGAVLDPITDKLFVATVVVSLVASGRLGWAAVVCLSTREIGEAPLVAWLAASEYLRHRHAKSAGANVYGKLVTVLQFACVALVVVFPHRSADATLLAVTGLAGVIAAVTYWHRVLVHRAALG
jgi:cardiolipin synthase